jgi:signal transduction histidine kinase
MNYWGEYKIKVAQTILGEVEAKENLSYYKNQLFYYIILYTLLFSPIAIIPGIFASYFTGYLNLLILNIALFFILILLAFIKSISIKLRKQLFLSALYISSWSLIFNLGLEGPGMMYLFTCTIVACLIYSAKSAYFLIVINSILLVIIGLNIEFEWLSLSLTQEHSTTTWFGITVNLIFVSVIIVACFELIFKKLEKIIINQRILNEKVRSDNEKMTNTQKVLKDKNEELSKFAHVIAHDLKEPLRTMQAFSELTISKYKEILPEKGQESLTHIKGSSLRMALLLDALLDYTQIGQSKELSSFSVEAIIEELKDDLNQLIKENKASIKYKNLPEIYGYELNFKQLLQNLIANAIKFKKDDENIQIEIEAKDKPHYWVFLVRDNGIGIDPKHQEKIFTIFQRLHKNRFPGTGLGLANCKKIVEMHEGKIWVESNLNEGSSFYFSINKNLDKQMITD